MPGVVQQAPDLPRGGPNHGHGFLLLGTHENGETLLGTARTCSTSVLEVCKTSQNQILYDFIQAAKL